MEKCTYRPACRHFPPLVDVLLLGEDTFLVEGNALVEAEDIPEVVHMVLEDKGLEEVDDLEGVVDTELEIKISVYS